MIKYCESPAKVIVNVDSNQSRIVSLYFTDNGHGIPKPYQSKIFKRFFRVPSGDRQQVKGFGMGLFYVKFILKKMKGEIKLTSSDSSGTTFTLKFQKP